MRTSVPMIVFLGLLATSVIGYLGYQAFKKRAYRSDLTQKLPSNPEGEWHYKEESDGTLEMTYSVLEEGWQTYIIFDQYVTPEENDSSSLKDSLDDLARHMSKEKKNFKLITKQISDLKGIHVGFVDYSFTGEKGISLFERNLLAPIGKQGMIVVSLATPMSVKAKHLQTFEEVVPSVVLQRQQAKDK